MVISAIYLFLKTKRRGLLCSVRISKVLFLWVCFLWNFFSIFLHICLLINFNNDTETNKTINCSSQNLNQFKWFIDMSMKFFLTLFDPRWKIPCCVRSQEWSINFFTDFAGVHLFLLVRRMQAISLKSKLSWNVCIHCIYCHDIGLRPIS